MGFETDETMRRYVNDNRQLFLNSLPTELFMEEFPGLLASSRQQIQCRLRTEGPWSANSLLIDAIVRQENFAYKLIKFCEERGQCIELARLLKKKLSDISRVPRESQNRNNLANSASTGASNGGREQREEGRQAPKTQTSRTESSSRRGVQSNDESQLRAEGMSELQGAQAANCESSSSSSSFYVDSAQLTEVEEEQHALNLKEVNLRPERELANTINIPPSSNNNAQAQQQVQIVPSNYAGIQCQEDAQKLKEDPMSSNTFDCIDRNNSGASSDPHETRAKTVYQREDRDEKPAREYDVQESKAKVTYFELSLLDVLGISTDRGDTTKGSSSVETSPKTTFDDRAIAPRQGDANNDQVEVLNTSASSSDGFSVGDNAASISSTANQADSVPTDSLSVVHREYEESLGNEQEHLVPGETETEAETFEEATSGNMIEDQEESDASDETVDEDNPNENPRPNQEIGTFLRVPIRAVAILFSGVGTIYRATANYLFRNT